MENQKLQLLPQTQTGIPEEWQEHFLLKRIEEEDIELTLQQRDAVLISLNKGDRFVQIGKYTLMLNSIKSIDPRYEPDNIPPRPKELNEIVGAVAVQTIESKKETELWDSIFGKKLFK